MTDIYYYFVHVTILLVSRMHLHPPDTSMDLMSILEQDAFLTLYWCPQSSWLCSLFLFFFFIPLSANSKFATSCDDSSTIKLGNEMWFVNVSLIKVLCCSPDLVSWSDADPKLSWTQILDCFRWLLINSSDQEWLCWVDVPLAKASDVMWT